MDFIEGIGERYLTGKAYAAPQMLENFAKKQFKSGSNKKPQTSAHDSPDEDNEVAKLRKELAEMKAEKKSAIGGTKSSAAKSKAHSGTKDPKVRRNKSSASKAKGSGGGAKEMEELIPLSIHNVESQACHQGTRGRSPSISTATAAKQAHKPPSEAKSGIYALHASEPGKAASVAASSTRGLEALGAKEALLHGKGGHEAASSASSVHAPSRQRNHSIGQQSEIGSRAGMPVHGEHSRGPPSEVGSRAGMSVHNEHSRGPPSEVGSLSSFAKRKGHSVAAGSEIGSESGASTLKAHSVVAQSVAGSHAGSHVGRHSVASKSVADSQAGSHVGRHSTAPKSVAGSVTSERHSVHARSVTGHDETRSNAASVATRPPPLPHPSHNPAYEQVIVQSTDNYEDEAPGLYVVEVEEDMPAPRLIKKVSVKRSQGERGKQQEDHVVEIERSQCERGGWEEDHVVEILHTKGRRLYKVG